MDLAKQYSADDIQVLSREEWFKKMIFDKAPPEPVYVIIGFLQEPAGGHILDGSLVESFYRNEAEKAEILRALCEKALEKAGLSNDVQLEKTESSLRVISKQAAAILAKHYTHYAHEFRGQKHYRLSAQDELFDETHDNLKQYSFLVGAFLRNHESEATLRFYGGVHKAEMAIAFLRNFSAFGSDNFTVSYSFAGQVDMTTIRLDEKNLFWQLIRDFKESLRTAAEI